jgi:hypothetical protein
MLRCGNLSYGYTFKGRSLSLPGEAIAAVNRTVFSGLEGNLRLAAATGADGREHFSLVCAAIFSGLTAGLASLGLIRKALFRVEFLFAGGEDKLAAAIFANENFVLGHGIEYLLLRKLVPDRFCPALSSLYRYKVILSTLFCDAYTKIKCQFRADFYK